MPKKSLNPLKKKMMNSAFDLVCRTVFGIAFLTIAVHLMKNGSNIIAVKTSGQ